MRTFLLGVAIWTLAGCGGSSEEHLTCLAKSTSFNVCEGTVLYQCPEGDDEWVDMIRIEDCADSGKVCEVGLGEAACVEEGGGSHGHILGNNPTAYVEANEDGNNSHNSAESTGYTLDTEGIAISGSFESSSATGDHFRFNTATFGRTDVQVFVDGVAQEEANHVITVSLNGWDDDYSTLYGNGYFINAWIQPNMDYVVAVSPSESAAGSSYIIEMKGNPE